MITFVIICEILFPEAIALWKVQVLEREIVWPRPKLRSSHERVTFF
jgi:hypothetical protein